MPELPHVSATRYLAPLREGGSLPGVMEADDLGTYVVKFAGAGQGRRALVAEVIVGEVARRLDIPVPALVTIDLSADLATFEADEEVQDLLRASIGRNLGVDFLPGSFGFDPTWEIDPALAARILWLDALVANVDRSWRNPNLLVWHRQMYAIDHGASLYFHHGWSAGRTDPATFARQPFAIDDHCLRAYASGVAAGSDEWTALAADAIEEAVDLVPEEWLEPHPGADGAAEVRAAYVAYLRARLAERPAWEPGGGR